MYTTHTHTHTHTHIYTILGTDQGLIVQPLLIQEIASNGSSVRDVPIPLDGYVIQNTIDADNNQFFIFTFANISGSASVRIHIFTPQTLAGSPWITQLSSPYIDYYAIYTLCDTLKCDQCWSIISCRPEYPQVRNHHRGLAVPRTGSHAPSPPLAKHLSRSLFHHNYHLCNLNHFHPEFLERVDHHNQRDWTSHSRQQQNRTNRSFAVSNLFRWYRRSSLASAAFQFVDALRSGFRSYFRGRRGRIVDESFAVACPDRFGDSYRLFCGGGHPTRMGGHTETACKSIHVKTSHDSR